ncbi:MAG: DUF177 domain-containing protein [Candidatus Marinimicrobia bacterium]|jgi:uncharacterized protein|nr:DUF177 domain-containing protein [Candidatus Neomarinimicrobiota bacterium]MBT3496744.1 DUF177 domain-containing protein [Candidatus Neomarinimicrobiota bacterium]MBT3692724.1 DUF177 domain-containing protein [Candidatus Neomarinimicrobiota bacterium]MBT3732878.1 DUF177 domain-containing protein [Candidatus Neomarinimicrobiota bacterium]MBT4144753.1 DUF177 domain-containing protein [Candidatus Neomarinimicrobiota bacterium]
MKLFRTELASEFKDKFFDIESAELQNEVFVAEAKNISCVLSAEKTKFGYQVSGKLQTELFLQCDRCLISFAEHHRIPVKLSLSPNPKLMETNEVDVLFIDKKQEFIDLTDPLLELILVDIPLKNLCKDNCLGLCEQCGADLNVKTCNCKS